MLKSIEDYMGDEYENAIAVIGMSCNFPESKNIDEYWDNLINNRECFTHFSKDALVAAGLDTKTLNNEKLVPVQGVIGNKKQFDADFFGLSQSEAMLLDPQSRKLLECSYHCFEHAKLSLQRLHKSVGVFISTDVSTYYLNHIQSAANADSRLAELRAVFANTSVATQISHKLGLNGPSYDVNSGCSSSLLSIHVACRNLLTYECDLALAGGASMHSQSLQGHIYQDGSIFSKDGRCCAFDVNATGTVRGEGAGCVLLKRLDEALADDDTIYAIIRGSAVNNDGSNKIGYTAPSVSGQSQVISKALAMSEIPPTKIDYVEAHGTGTKLGDPIEAKALLKSYASQPRPTPCYLGSVKTNIGHLSSAAGVAGFIKLVLSLHHKLIPASLHFNKLNKEIDFTLNTFSVASENTDWPERSHPSLAGISSFGIGGTNVHAIVEQAETMSQVPQEQSSSDRYLPICLSAQSQSALSQQLKNIARYLSEYPKVCLADLSYSLIQTRDEFQYRHSFNVKTTEQLHDALCTTIGSLSKNNNLTPLSSKRYTLLLGGEGNTLGEIGKELYHVDSTFTETIKACSKIANQHLEIDIEEMFYLQIRCEKQESLFSDILYQHVLLFISQYALATVCLEKIGQPENILGYGIGELVAATLANVFSVTDALNFIINRAKLLQKLPEAGMLSVAMNKSDLKLQITTDCHIVAHNGPDLYAVTGPIESIIALHAQLDNQNINVKRLNLNVPLYCLHCETITSAIKEIISSISFHKPTMKIISTSTMAGLTNEQASTPEYWIRQITKPINCAGACDTLYEEQGTLLALDVSATGVLQNLVSIRESFAKKVDITCLYPRERPPFNATGYQALNEAIIQLWSKGAALKLGKYFENMQANKISLPLYPFDEQEYWIDAKTQVSELKRNSQDYKSLTVAETVTKIWQETLGITEVNTNDHFLKLGGDSIMALQMNASLMDELQVKLPLQVFLESLTLNALVGKVIETKLASVPEADLEKMIEDIS